MTEHESKNIESKKENTSSLIGPLLVAILLGVIIFRFIYQLSEVGWAVASKQSPGGALLFILACIAAYIIAAELIYTKLSKPIGKTMGWILALLILFFILGKMPSCSSYDSQEQTDIYYRK